MSKIYLETRDHLRLTLRLIRKTLYKTIEFQILLKVFYISILFFVLNFIINTIFDIINSVVSALRLGEAVNNIKILSFIDIRVVIILSVSLLVITYVYLIEKNGVIIIESEYYRNKFTSFFQVLILSVRKTPLFIWRRIREMRIAIIVFIGFYIMWKIIEKLALPEWFMTASATILFIYGAILFFSVLFRYTFTAYITLLESGESPKNFNDNMPNKFFRKRTRVSVIFYTVLFIAVFVWLITFAFIAQILFNLSVLYPSFFSTIFAFFISFTIVSVLVFLSFFKTFKVGIMTVLYYEERKRQNFNIKILEPKNKPILSKNIYLSILSVIAIVIIGGILLTTSIKVKTDQIIENADEYIEQLKKEEQLLTGINLEDLSIRELVKEAFSQGESTVDVIEKILLSYLVYVIDK